MSRSAYVGAATFRPSMVTRAPWTSKTRVMAAPIPRAPPVTTACLPARSCDIGWSGARLTLVPEVTPAPCFAPTAFYPTGIDRAIERPYIPAWPPHEKSTPDPQDEG